MKTRWMVVVSVLALPAFALAAEPSPTKTSSKKQTTTKVRDGARDAALEDIQKAFGFVPRFLAGIPGRALPGVWDEMKSIQLNPNTALSAKDKELIGLAVAAQIPCEYCVYAHTEFAKLGGATDEQIGECVALGALTRHWSTYLNGMQIDAQKFDKELERMVEGSKKPPSAAKSTPIEVVDATTARADIERTFGFVPEFLAMFPPEGLAGAWRSWRDVELSPSTSIDAKTKSLISLAVASQIPCAYCVKADTTFAQLGGATEREIREAVAMSSLIREMSTLLNGLQADRADFRKDIRQIVEMTKRKRAS